MRVILLIDTDKTGDNLYSRTELGTLRIYTCMYAMGESTKRWALTLLKVDEPFGPWFHFKKKNWEPTSVNVRVILLVKGVTTGECLHPYIELRTLRVYTHMYTADFIDKEIDFHTTKNSTSLSAFGSIF